MELKILAVDDDIKVLTSLELALSECGYDVTVTTHPKECLTIVEEQDIQILLTDLNMPELHGSDLIKEVLARFPDITILVLTGFGTVKSAVELMKQGVFDYITKPYNIDELQLVIERAAKQRRLTEENRLLKKKIEESCSFCDIVGTTNEMKKVFTQIETFAKVDVNVLILGESGTGKELVARALHERSHRNSLPFVTTDCGAITGTLLESEVFGHVKGAFTNATGDKKGYIDIAGDGSIFFDEIGELAMDFQKKLLRIIEYKEYSKVGSPFYKKTNARVIAATNKDLIHEIKAGRFREDLYFRLKVATIQLPPLRHRKADIPILCEYFADRFNRRYDKNISKIRSSAMKILMDYHWPGNVRQLQNLLETIWIGKENAIIGEEDFPEDLIMPGPLTEKSFQDTKTETISRFEKEYLTRLMVFCRGNVKKAADMADVERRNFIKLLNRNGINPEQYKNRGNHNLIDFVRFSDTE